MSNRRRPFIVSTRTTRAEKALIRAVADAEGVSVCDLLHRILLPAVAERVTRQAAEIGGKREAAGAI